MYQIVMQYPGHGVEELEWEITDRQYLKYLVSEYRMMSGGEYPVWSRYQKPTRYYISLLAPSGNTYYAGWELEDIKVLTKMGGGKNVRTANQFGWANQPQVVTFSGYSREERNVTELLREHGYHVVINEKDW